MKWHRHSVVAMALMTGYSEDLQRKLIGGNAGVVAYALDRSRTTVEQRAAIAEQLVWYGSAVTTMS